MVLRVKTSRLNASIVVYALGLWSVFFFLNVFTDGIGHKENKRRVVEYSCGTRVGTTGCTNEGVGFIVRSLSNCQNFYRNQPGNLKSNKKKKKCNFSAMGCATFEDPICDL